jgi:hypothetical protein
MTAMSARSASELAHADLATASRHVRVPGTARTYEIRDQLRGLGLRWDPATHAWHGTIPAGEEVALEREVGNHTRLAHRLIAFATDGGRARCFGRRGYPDMAIPPFSQTSAAVAQKGETPQGKWPNWFECSFAELAARLATSPLGRSSTGRAEANPFGPRDHLPDPLTMDGPTKDLVRAPSIVHGRVEPTALLSYTPDRLPSMKSAWTNTK